MPKINQEEYEVLQFLNNTKDWIVRNPDGQLWAVEGEAPWKAPFYETWKEGDGQDVSKVDVSSFLFQFIQWEDEEPYSITELIEEYEESEETEVNKQKLIEKWESAIEAAEFYGRGKEDRLIEYMRNFVDDLNQLDEPEVLTQKWIDEKSFPIIHQAREKDVVPVKDLKDKLVKKQELPVIPQFVADWIEESHSLGNNLNHDIFNLITDAYDTDADERKLIENYLYDSSDAIETIVDAYRYGYEVAEEQKYYVIDKDDNILLLRGYKGIEKADNLKISNSGGGALKLTEQEIKDYDERYWAFAVKVEELEE